MTDITQIISVALFVIGMSALLLYVFKAMEDESDDDDDDCDYGSMYLG